MEKRLHYLDTLRVIAVFMVFVFHATSPFTTGDWHIWNADTSLVASVLFLAFLAPWGMPFFFLLSGAATWFALQRRSARQFAAERFSRLLVPYLIGCALLTPVQAYFEWRFSVRAESFSGSYLDMLVFERWGGWNPSILDWLGYHLWFLGFLFVISLVTLPLLQWLKQPAGSRFVSRLAGLCERRGGILLFILPLLLCQLGLRPLSPNDHSWGDFFYYLVFFVAGYLFYADARFLRAIQRDFWLVFGVGIAALLGLVTTFALGDPETWFWDPSEGGFFLLWAIAPVDAWCWSLVMLVVGIRFLDFSKAWTRYGQQAVVPFYVFHQPVIVAIAFYVVQWQAGVTVKMAVVVLGSFLVTMAIYELLIRRIGPFRRAFGMKAPAAETAAAGLEART